MIAARRRAVTSAVDRSSDAAGTAAAHAPRHADGCADPRRRHRGRRAGRRDLAAVAAAAGRRQHARALGGRRPRAGLRAADQIAGRILQGKEVDALGQAEAGAAVLERELAGVDPDGEGAQGELNKALDRLTNASLSDDAGSPSAGRVPRRPHHGPREPGGVDGAGASEVSAGTVADVPADLRGLVAGRLARPPLRHRSPREASTIPTLIIGQPVRTRGPRPRVLPALPAGRASSARSRWCAAR